MPVVAIPWSEATEAEALASGDVGISWIPDDLWSRGKCGLKVLQYQAAGLPVVANPVGVHPEMIEPGVSGFLATTADEWVDAVKALADRPFTRRRMGRAARASVVSRYSVEAWAPAFLAAIGLTRREHSPTPTAEAEGRCPAPTTAGLADPDRAGDRTSMRWITAPATRLDRTPQEARMNIPSRKGPTLSLPDRLFQPPRWHWTQAGEVGWWVCGDWRDALLGPTGLRLEEWRRRGQLTIVKDGPHRIVYRADLDEGTVYVKHFLVPNLRAKVRQWFRRGKGRNEGRRARHLAEIGVPTITPIALGEQRRHVVPAGELPGHARDPRVAPPRRVRGAEAPRMAGAAGDRASAASWPGSWRT